ncbi:MAG: ATP-grasp domain-containing protein [Spirochaetota bacterium]|nr:ATP-grasp domain-containing protein [Spirochaetota bacterium]
MFITKKKYQQHDFFVSIGAGFNQIPIIDEARRLGFKVIGVDKNISAVGIPKCDLKILESIDNHEDILQKLHELLVDGQIKAVLSKSFGPAIKTTCFISNNLNIPLIPYNRIDDFIDKKRMKTIFTQNDIKSSDFRVFHQKDYPSKIKKKEFPLVIKPIIGHAKMDVELLENTSDLSRYLQKAPSNRHLEYMIEKYIEGDEIIAVGIVHNKKYHLIDIIDKIKTPPPFFVDIMHISPSKYMNLWDKIINIGQKVSDAFEISTSPLIMELIITKEESINVIEAVPEFGGEFLPEILIPSRTGYNFIREAIKATISNDFKPPKKTNGKDTIVVKYITGQKGILSSFDSDQPIKQPDILYSRMFSEIGSKIKDPMTNHDRIGVIIAKGKMKGKTIETAKKAETSMNIEIMVN